MSNERFEKVAATKENSNYLNYIKREQEMQRHPYDLRSEFGRDYTRLLHSLAYRRLKHKTQVFFNVSNDHVCTRMEHVAHVESVSYTIANALGLNTELTKAIAIGHDLGHAPFGHQGERILDSISRDRLNKSFWHEKNGLRFVDKIELLENDRNEFKNLNLTYAVRDGIISHCGEVDEQALYPREEFIDLESIQSPGEFQAITWEGCVVKISDKIAYLGRDIEDAIRLGILNEEGQKALGELAKTNGLPVINTTVIINDMIEDICRNSSVDNGIRLSEEMCAHMDCIKKFNYEHIYGNKKLIPFSHYAELIIHELYDALYDVYDGENTIRAISERMDEYPELMKTFAEWLVRYCEQDLENPKWVKSIRDHSKNEKIYGHLEDESLYIQAILDYISGMTDQYAIEVFRELLKY
ncbi:deoxyguanosinetriphosphate triphosphohydrolase [Lachnospiraceae bacterium KM106-2]|nr:deoxyguanosinetriphosphate triphosphohydrolase [Lachnospiraceae bacterium KM106-2]